MTIQLTPPRSPEPNFDGHSYSIHSLNEGIWEVRIGGSTIARLEEWGTGWIVKGHQDCAAPEVFSELPAAVTAATYRY